ncbi:MAG TPA: hypothetical protein VF512_03595 [Actinomycetota bacterium]
MSVAALLLGVFSFTQQYAPLAVAESHTIQPTQASLWLRPGGRSADAHS